MLKCYVYYKQYIFRTQSGTCYWFCYLCLQVGGVPQGQIAVYEEFARSIPGFLPTPEANQPPGFLAKLTQVGDDDDSSASSFYHICYGYDELDFITFLINFLW